jgi:hypothetical protein
MLTYYREAVSQPIPDTSVVYAPADLDRIVEILTRAAGGREVDREAVHRDLVALVYAIGRAPEAWKVHPGADDLSHRALADGSFTPA